MHKIVNMFHMNWRVTFFPCVNLVCNVENDSHHKSHLGRFFLVYLKKRVDTHDRLIWPPRDQVTNVDTSLYLVWFIIFPSLF